MLALPEMTEKIIQEMGESYSEAEDYLSRSILCDPKRHVLMLCSQVEPIPITDCFTESRLSCCKKIGEGVYGEVFMTMPNPNSMDGATVLKIMPIEGDFDVNGEPQKKFEGDYQFEIYRQMKTANKNEWQSFTPYTNVLWLHYILDKMINECYYKNVKTKVHKTNMDQLHKLKQTMLDSESATAFVLRRELDLT